MLEGNTLQGPEWSAVLLEDSRYEVQSFTLPIIYTRLAYAVWMLQKLIEAHSTTGSDVYIMYDVACSLSRHLHVCHLRFTYYMVIIAMFYKSQGRSDLLDVIHLCLPTFHCYGHKASCQVHKCHRYVGATVCRKN